jgi:hypothetical protein
MKKGALAGFVLVILFLVSAFSMDAFSGATDSHSVRGFHVAQAHATSLAASAAIGVDDGLELTMTLEKTEYIVGEPINLTLALANISNQSITFPLAAWTFDFQVYNGTNNFVFVWSRGQVFPQYIILDTLGVGENLTELRIWKQTCNVPPYSEGVSVSPGTYYIVGTAYGLQTTPMQIIVANALIPGDLNGDGKVNLADLVILAKAYGSRPGDANWNPNADIDGKDIIGLSDLMILAQHYGQHQP